MMNKLVSDYDITQYDYNLPEEMIAQVPAEPRDSSRLLVLHRDSGAVEHRIFRDIGEFLRTGDVLVLNDTKVMPTRFYGKRSTGGKIEVFFLRDVGDGQWEAMVRGRPRPGEFLNLADGKLSVRLLRRGLSGHWLVSAPRGVDPAGFFRELGRMPLPPYIRRGADAPEEKLDRERYQTVYAREEGAVAAPTAGLHFTQELLEKLRGQGVGTAEVTLHIGAGTFLPIKEEDIRRHKIHEEFYTVSPDAASRILETKKSGGRIVAVGTTSCRTLEAATVAATGFGPGGDWTRLYIYPPYAFKMTDVLLTNFHLPRSTLMALVAAFAGRERILSAYEEAKREGYRFFSYGDAMLIL